MQSEDFQQVLNSIFYLQRKDYMSLPSFRNISLLRSQKEIITKNYQRHYSRLKEIMHTTRGNTFHSISKNFHKKSIQSYPHRLKTTTPKILRPYNQIPTINRHLLTKAKHMLHYVESPHKIKKCALMMLIKFTSLKLFCKNSSYLIQIQGAGLKSRLLTYSDLQNVSVGFKLPFKKKPIVNVYEIRGNRCALIITNEDPQNIVKYGIKIQTKIQYVQKSQNQEKFKADTPIDSPFLTNQKEQRIMKLSRTNKINQYIE